MKKRTKDDKLVGKKRKLSEKDEKGYNLVLMYAECQNYSSNIDFSLSACWLMLCAQLNLHNSDIFLTFLIQLKMLIRSQSSKSSVSKTEKKREK